MKTIKDLIPEAIPPMQDGRITIERGSQEHFNIAWRIFAKAMATRTMADTGRKLIIDDQIRIPLSIFIAWASHNHTVLQRYNINPKKGLLLYGNVGSGKSVLFRTLRDIKQSSDESAQLFRGITFDKCEKIAKLYQSDGDKALMRYTQGVLRHGESTMLRNYCFDDLGNEESKNHYGNQREVMKDIIDERYDDFLDHGLITCFTTNLSMAEIEKRYDRRTRSRIQEMCSIIGIGTQQQYIDRRVG